MEIDGDMEFSCTPPDLAEAASAATIGLLPSKSRHQYDSAYNRFMEWSRQKNAKHVTENVLLAYFAELSNKYKSSTMWAQYSMIKACLITKDNVDISKFSKLVAFLKRKSEGYRAKKSMVFTRENVQKFLLQAEDEEYLMMKVVLVFGIAGACRCDELLNLLTDNIEDLGSTLIVKIPDSKTKIERSFIVNERNMLDIYRKYVSLRPVHTNHKRIFIYYKKGKCSTQVVGKNKLGQIPRVIAQYLKLKDPSRYTGHCLRRTSATFLADTGADITTIKRHGGWKSTTVAEGYLEDSIQNKTNTASKVLNVAGGTNTGASTSASANISDITSATGVTILNSTNLIKEHLLEASGINLYHCHNVNININKL